MGFNKTQWDLMGFNKTQWDFNGISMGCQWDFNGIYIMGYTFLVTLG